MNIPEGWKLVPEHWTEEIAEAMADAFCENCSKESIANAFCENCSKESIANWLHLRPMYEAALAAAPTPPAQDEPVAWIDEFGNVFPLAAWSGKVKSYLDQDYKNWKPLYTHPQSDKLRKAAEKALFMLRERGYMEGLTALGKQTIENLEKALEVVPMSNDEILMALEGK